jgi:hypothetical protein
MQFLINTAWILVKFFSYGGLVVALVGVAIFGWYFVGINARAAKIREEGEIPQSSWRGKGARRGYLLIAIGIGLQILSMILAAILPNSV